jgi:protein associated with RNAse G/E
MKTILIIDKNKYRNIIALLAEDKIYYITNGKYDPLKYVTPAVSSIPALDRLKQQDGIEVKDIDLGEDLTFKNFGIKAYKVLKEMPLPCEKEE